MTLPFASACIQTLSQALCPALKKSAARHTGSFQRCTSPGEEESPGLDAHFLHVLNPVSWTQTS